MFEKRIREFIWLNHGCPIRNLYGDDGEMQCNNPGCLIDFKRTPIDEILNKIEWNRLKRITPKLTQERRGKR